LSHLKRVTTMLDGTFGLQDIIFQPKTLLKP
jgi:hypothetical protein